MFTAIRLNRDRVNMVLQDAVAKGPTGDANYVESVSSAKLIAERLVRINIEMVTD